MREAIFEISSREGNYSEEDLLDPLFREALLMKRLYAKGDAGTNFDYERQRATPTAGGDLPAVNGSGPLQRHAITTLSSLLMGQLCAGATAGEPPYPSWDSNPGPAGHLSSSPIRSLISLTDPVFETHGEKGGAQRCRVHGARATSADAAQAGGSPTVRRASRSNAGRGPVGTCAHAGDAPHPH